MSRSAFPPLLALYLVAAACSGGERDAHEDAGHRDRAGASGAERAAPAGAGARDAAEASGPPADGSAGAIRVPLEGLTGVAFAEVGAPVEEGVWSAAEALPDESARSAISAPVAGIVVAIRAVPGRAVDASAPLVALRSSELAALRSELLAARAAAARLALDARGLDPEGTGATLELRARRAGRVAAWSVLEGAGVAAGETLGVFEAGGAALVRVELALPGAPGWRPGVAARVRRADGVEWRALVEGVPQSLDAATRRLAYRLRIASAGSEEPLPVAGTPLEVRVPLPPAIVLPQTALQQIEGAWGVFVVEGGVAEFRLVRRGPELGGDVLVVDGVAPGELVATSGADLLKALHLKRAGGGDAHAH
jgi:multidrug efflux pump subunit AcrA (membrane-fusion protein)